MQKVHLKVLVLLILLPTLAFAQKPKWVIISEVQELSNELFA